MYTLRALEAITKLALRLQSGLRCAILLLEDDHFCVAAGGDLLPADHVLLERICGTSSVAAAAALGKSHCAEVLGLLTESTEIVGLIVFLGHIRNGLLAEAQIDEICQIAALALEERNLFQDLDYRAHHDPLTHCWNRSRMEQEIKNTLEDSCPTGNTTGVILLGIDEFRLFNELLGRQAGDQLLQLIAKRLTDSIPPNCFVARVGSDEFLILIPAVEDSAGAIAFARQLRSQFEEPFIFGDHHLVVRASFATAVAEANECQSNELQNRADQALLFAKRFAKGKVTNYSREMAKTPPERLVMERHLRFALQKREFVLNYQPQVNLLTGCLIGVEALLRWKHPSLGFISPAVFIPIAEEIGIIEEIGDWVLTEAIHQLEAWNVEGLNDIHMAVNVSPIQFARDDFAVRVAQHLRRARISPRDLELEVTETSLMTDLDHGCRQLTFLRSLGVQIALDDFGTGHSSLAYLQKLPIDRLKIDRMFVKSIETAQERPVLLASIIQMGLQLGCRTIAEGVETREQAAALTALHCQEAQGFLFSKPLAPSDLLRWASSNRPAVRTVEYLQNADCVVIPA